MKTYPVAGALRAEEREIMIETKSTTKATQTTLFTILLPVYRPPAMLPFAIESVLAQTQNNFELMVIGDGAPDETIECARSFAIRDTRVKVFAFTKGAMCGEAHRHTVLNDAAGKYVAHISDDDLWLPNHLVEMEKLLCQVDFGHLIHVYIDAGDSYEVLASDLTDRRLRQRILTEEYNTLGDTVTGYRLSAYRCLPEGWAPPPEMAHPDLKMWRKFLRNNDLVFGTRAVVTALNFATDRRPQMTLEERGQENERWWRKVMDPETRAEIVEKAWHSLSRAALHTDQNCQDRLGVIHDLQTKLERLESLRDYRLAIGGTIDFSATGNSPLFTVSGWSFQDLGSRWTDGAEAVIKVRFEVPANQATLNIVIHLHAHTFGRPQRVIVSIDDVKMTEVTVDNAVQVYKIDAMLDRLPGSICHKISFQLPDAHSPKSIGQSEDGRQLGIAVSAMTFLSGSPNDGAG